MADEPQYTPADAWPENDGGHDLELPSGAKARVAVPAVVYLGMTGATPAHLQAIAKHHVADKSEWTPGELKQLLDWLICESFLEPRVSLGKKAGCVPLAKVIEADRQAVVLDLNLHVAASALK